MFKVPCGYDALLHPALRLIGERDHVAIERMGGMNGNVALVHHKHWNSGWFLQHETILTINLNLGTALRRMWDKCVR
jgi:hypothetical protein